MAVSQKELNAMANRDTLKHTVSFQRKWLVCFFTLLVAVSVNAYSLGIGAQGGANIKDFTAVDSNGNWGGEVGGTASLLFWQNWGGHWGINADFTQGAIALGLSLDWLGAAWEISSGRFAGRGKKVEVAGFDTKSTSFTLNWGFGPGLFADWQIMPNGLDDIWGNLSVGVRLPILFFISFTDDSEERPKSTVFLQVTPNFSTTIAKLNQDFDFAKDVGINAAFTVGFVFWTKAKQEPKQVKIPDPEPEPDPDHERMITTDHVDIKVREIK
jgi:hypothetical protein